MIDYQQAVEAANHWRCTEGEARHLVAGIVRVYDGKVYGWCAELGDAHTERPGALAIDARGTVWEAIGGNAQDGAREWDEIEQPCTF